MVAVAPERRWRSVYVYATFEIRCCGKITLYSTGVRCAIVLHIEIHLQYTFELSGIYNAKTLDTIFMSERKKPQPDVDDYDDDRLFTFFGILYLLKCSNGFFDRRTCMAFLKPVSALSERTVYMYKINTVR